MAELLTAALGNAGTIISQGVEIITGNDLCMVFIAMGLIRSGLGTFGVAKSVAM